MTKTLQTVLEKMNIMVEENTDKEQYSVLSVGGFEVSHYIEVVQIGKADPFIVRLRLFNEKGETKLMYFTFKDEKELITWLKGDYKIVVDKKSTAN